MLMHTYLFIAKYAYTFCLLKIIINGENDKCTVIIGKKKKKNFILEVSLKDKENANEGQIKTLSYFVISDFMYKK